MRAEILHTGGSPYQYPVALEVYEYYVVNVFVAGSAGLGGNRGDDLQAIAIPVKMHLKGLVACRSLVLD